MRTECVVSVVLAIYRDSLSLELAIERRRMMMTSSVHISLNSVEVGARDNR